MKFALLTLLLVSGCSKSHYVFEMQDGELVATDSKKAQPILAQGGYIRYDTYKTVTRGGAKRAFKRKYHSTPHDSFNLIRPLLNLANHTETHKDNESQSSIKTALPTAEPASQERADAEAAAKALLATIQKNITIASWSKESFSSLAKQADSLYPDLPANLRGKLHAAVGLYAMYASDSELATREFCSAKDAGFQDYRAILPGCWTGGSIVMFNEAQGGNEP